MKFKGSKGEWKHDMPTSTRLEGILTNSCDMANDKGNYIATIYGNTPKVCTANAKLISASPELLEALQGAMRIRNLWVMSGQVAEQHRDEARALDYMFESFKKAINKALK